MYILALDTSAKTATASVCKVVNNMVYPLCDARLNSTMTHSESILPMIDYCLKNASVSLDMIKIIAVSQGPGSFTGVRIGISTVKGLAFSNPDLRCVGVSSLKALAHNADDERRGTVICACMDARRNQVYNALFLADGKGNIKRVCDDRAISVDDLFAELRDKYCKQRIVAVGDGAELFYNSVSKNADFCDMKISLARCDRLLQDATSVARCAYFDIDKAVSSDLLNPVYLRLSQAERERNERMNENDIRK